MPLAAPIARLVALPFRRERYVERVTSVVDRYTRMQAVDADPTLARRRRVELMYTHPTAWSELECLDTDAVTKRRLDAQAELRCLREDMVLPAPPARVERTRVLAVADLEWLLREYRVLTRRAGRRGVADTVAAYHARPGDPIPGIDAATVAALIQVPRGRRVGAMLEVVALRHQLDDLRTYLFPRTAPAPATTRTVVGPLDDIRDGRAARVDVGGETIAVFRIGERLSAIEDTCPHRGGPLGRGAVTDGHVFCPLHGWAFDLETGCLRGNDNVRVRTFEVGVDDQDIVWVGPEKT